MTLVWARMPGFAPWPARLSTVYEQTALELSKTSKKTAKTDQTAVVFLGADYQRLHCIKTFKRTRTYQAALFEAIRVYNVQQHQLGRLDQLITNELCRSLLPLNKTLDESLSAMRDNCSVCGGTSHSGPYLDCAECASSFLHFHCLDPPICRRPKHDWRCRKCCYISGQDYEAQLTVDKSVYIRVKEKERAAMGGRGSGARRAVRNADEAFSVKLEADHIDGLITPSHKDRDVTADLITSQSRCRGSSTGVKRKNSAISNIHSNCHSTSFECTNKDRTNRKHSMDTSSDAVAPVSTSANTVSGSTQMVEDDRCFLCGEGGVLMLCDFPACPRVYHKPCVLKVSEQSVEEDEGGDMTFAGKGLGREQARTEDWFCPLHNCVSCDMNGLVRRKLRSCMSCPTSLCASCESDIGLGRSFFKSKKLDNFGKVAVKCLNCASPDPRIRLAKVLEGAWVRMCRSRLATPFIVRLLPGVSASGAGGAANAITVGTSKQIHLQQQSLQGTNGFSNTDSIVTNDSEQPQVFHSENRLTWSNDFVELFGSVPSMTTRMFQLGFYSNELSCSIHNQHQACIKTKYSSISNYAGKSVNSFLDILEKIHNLRYFSIHDILTDLVVLRRKLKHILWQLSIQKNDFQVSNDATSSLPSSTVHHMPPHEVSTTSNEEMKLFSFPDILHAFDTIIAVGLTYITASKQQIAYSENLIRLRITQSTRSVHNTSACKANSSSAMCSVSGSSTDVQGPQLVDDETQTYSQYNTTSTLCSTDATETPCRVADTDDINLVCSGERDDEKNSDSERRTTTEPLTMRKSQRISTSSNSSAKCSYTGAHSFVQINEIIIGSAKTDTCGQPNILTRRQSQNELDRYNAVTEKFSALWRVSCSTRFLGNTSPVSADKTVFVRQRSIRCWERFVQEGAVGEVLAKRRVNRMSTSKHEELVREKVSIWLNHTNVQEFMSDKDAACAMLSISEENSLRDRNMHNETVSLLENVYGEPALPWSIAKVACSNVVEKLASNYDSVQRKKSRGIGHDVRSSGSHTTATANYSRNERVRAQSSTLFPYTSLSHSTQIQNGLVVGSTCAAVVDQNHSFCSDNAEIDEIPGLNSRYSSEWDNPDDFTDQPDSLYEDETLIALDRLRVLTQRTLHLQARIRKQYLSRRDESLAVPSSGILNFGNCHLVMELKFANDNLRWRLQQKQASLNSSQETIARLQAALGVLEGEVHTLRRDAKAAAKELTNTIKRLEAENATLKRSYPLDT